MGAAPFSENCAVSRYAAVLSADDSIIALNGGCVKFVREWEEMGPECEV